MKYGFGVDVGGTTVKLGLLSEAGELLEKWELPTRTENGGENILPDIARSVQDCMARRGLTALASASACPARWTPPAWSTAA